MVRVELSERAQADFEDILDYLAEQASPAIAERYGQDIRASINRLAEFPYQGAPRPELGAHIRIMIVYPYLVFYDPVTVPRLVKVLRILHGHRNVTGELLRGGG
jgi:plasmid stabilization system protein ParE